MAGLSCGLFGAERGPKNGTTDATHFEGQGKWVSCGLQQEVMMITRTVQKTAPEELFNVEGTGMGLVLTYSTKSFN